MANLWCSYNKNMNVKLHDPFQPLSPIFISYKLTAKAVSFIKVVTMWGLMIVEYHFPTG